MKKKILILYGPLIHYRVALFNELCHDYDVTVVVSSFDGERRDLNFRLFIIEPWKLWRFRFQFGLRGDALKERYDVCIAFIDIAWLSYLSMVFFPIRCKTIAWGAWRTKSKIANLIRRAAIDAADSAIFYCDAHLNDFVNLGARREKLYVAHNTVKVSCTRSAHDYHEKDLILFVGTLDSRKGNEALIRVFHDVLSLIPRSIKLAFIGAGPQQALLMALADEMNLSGRVQFLGRITEDSMLDPFYRRAIVSVSLNQAGLSVLQSMGFGVPFLTTKGAVTGGESSNIVHGQSGTEWAGANLATSTVVSDGLACFAGVTDIGCTALIIVWSSCW